ncbi:IS3 family transposase [Paenibacillus barengoltzii]
MCLSLEVLSIKINRYIHYYNIYRYQWERKKMTPV